MLFFVFAAPAAPPIADVSSVTNLPTAAIVGLPVGAVGVLAFLVWIACYVRTERKSKARKQQCRRSASVAAQDQRHNDPGANKDPSSATPCLANVSDQDSLTNNRLLPAPSNVQPSYTPYSVRWTLLDDLEV